MTAITLCNRPDLKQLKDAADQMTPPEHRGMAGGIRQMKDGVAQANQAVGALQGEQATSQYLMVSGIVGQGTITGVRDTGMTVNENPRLEIDLTITLPGGAPYQVTHQQVVSRVVIGNFHPGASVPVRVDPNDHAVIMLA